MNYSELYKAYSTIGRNPAISPKSLLKIIFYGYMEGIYSSRDLEKAWKRGVNFKWLLEGQIPPEHNTFAIFKSERLSNCIEDLFSQKAYIKPQTYEKSKTSKLKKDIIKSSQKWSCNQCIFKRWYNSLLDLYIIIFLIHFKRFIFSSFLY